MWWVLAWMLLIPIGWALSGPEALPDGLVDNLSAGLSWLGGVLPGPWGESLASTSPADVSQWLGPAPVPSTEWLTGALAVGAGVALLGFLAPVHATTIVHELGHGLVGAALGARILGMVTSRDGSGHVRYQFSGPAPMRSALTGLAGYPFPGILGLAGAQLALAGLAGTWLVYLAVLMTVLLAAALRSWWAALVAVGLAATATLTLAFGSNLVIAGSVMALAGALAVQGGRQALTQWSLCRAGRRCDATIIAKTRRPLAYGIAGAHVVTTWALAAALPWLVLR